MSKSQNDLNLHPATLIEWLREKKPVQIIDIRPTQDYDEWHIAEAENIYVYHDLQRRRPGLLEDFQPESEDTPVVAVCFAGNTSQIAANYLQSRGINALSLMGGMNRWSLAWNDAEVPLKNSKAKVIQVRRTGKGCLSYIIGSEGEAVVIDASVEPEVYLEFANDNFLEIKQVLDTHIHADHLTRSRVLADLAGAQYRLPDQDRTDFEFTPFNKGDVIEFGSSKIKAIATPGHTYESMSFLLDDEALFTGDTLFKKSIGRPDLKAFDKTEIEDRAAALYDTLQDLTNLPEETLVLPGHTSQPVAFTQPAISATIGQAKSEIVLLKLEKEEFVDTILPKIPDTPPNHLQIVNFNEKGVFPQTDITKLEAGANRCAI